MAISAYRAVAPSKMMTAASPLDRQLQAAAADPNRTRSWRAQSSGRVVGKRRMHLRHAWQPATALCSARVGMPRSVSTMALPSTPDTRLPITRGRRQCRKQAGGMHIVLFGVPAIATAQVL
jgi:hypothetical protein